MKLKNLFNKTSSFFIGLKMKHKILELLEEKKFHSGEKLARKLNVSRTAIWKQIKSLKELGYDIYSVKNKGYRLISRPDIPTFEEVSLNLDTKIIGKNIHYFRKLDSTNIYAKNLLKNGASEGDIVISDIQKSGRGRKNRVWYSPFGGLWFSVILFPIIPPQNAMLITMTCSVSIAQGIYEIIDVKPEIKWPNDLLIHDKKVCGILTELDAEIDKINYSIVGIGINVNNKIINELKDIAVSLKEVTGFDISRVELLRSILKNLDKNYSMLKSNKYEDIRNLWFSFSNMIGQKIKVDNEKSTLIGIVKNIDENGCLILDVKGKIKRIITGDISYL